MPCLSLKFSAILNWHASSPPSPKTYCTEFIIQCRESPGQNAGSPSKPENRKKKGRCPSYQLVLKIAEKGADPILRKTSLLVSGTRRSVEYEFNKTKSTP